MTEIKVNRKKNLCYIKLSGYMEEQDVIDAKLRFCKAIDALEPGIAIINDISEFQPMTQELAMHIAEAQKYAFVKGVNQVIRVVKSPLSNMQFKRVQLDSGVTYDTMEVSTVDEAMRAIDTKKN